MAVVNSTGNALTGSTGTGNFVGANTPTLITPVLGAATGTSLNLGSSTTMTGMIDDDTMGTASASTTASSESIKAYADSVSGSSAATQAEMETATSTTVFSSPGRQQYHPGHPKAWVFYTQTGTPAVLDSYNVTSVTDAALGIFIVNWATDFSSTSYSTTATTSSAGGGNNLIGIGVSGAGAVASRQFGCIQLTSQIDRPFNSVAAFGDQA